MTQPLFLEFIVMFAACLLGSRMLAASSKILKVSDNELFFKDILFVGLFFGFGAALFATYIVLATPLDWLRRVIALVAASVLSHVVYMSLALPWVPKLNHVRYGFFYFWVAAWLLVAVSISRMMKLGHLATQG